jgi:hypothetical protein
MGMDGHYSCARKPDESDKKGGERSRERDEVVNIAGECDLWMYEL